MAIPSSHEVKAASAIVRDDEHELAEAMVKLAEPDLETCHEVKEVKIEEDAFMQDMQAWATTPCYRLTPEESRRAGALVDKYITVPRDTDDHVIVEIAGKQYNSRWAKLGSVSQKNMNWVAQASQQVLMRFLLLVITAMSNAEALKFVRSAGVMCGKVSKALLIHNAHHAFPRIRIQTLRNLVIVALMMGFQLPETAASVSAVSQFNASLPAIQLINQTRNGTGVFLLSNHTVQDLAFVNVDVLQNHFDECLREPDLWNFTNCDAVLREFQQRTLVRRVAQYFPLEGALTLANNTASAAHEFTQYFYFQIVLRMDVAILLAGALWVLILVLVTLLTFGCVRRTRLWWKTRRLLTMKQVMFDQTEPLQFEEWIQTTSRGVMFKSSRGTVILSPEDMKRVLDAANTTPTMFESPKEGSIARPVVKWPQGGCWLLRSENDQLKDNGGCTRVRFKNGKEYLVTTRHQMTVYANGETVFLQGQTGSRSCFQLDVARMMCTETLELALVPMVAKYWPQGVAVATFREPQSAQLDNLVGTFYGMINGKLHSSNGKIDRPRALQVGHLAWTDFGWCGWPVEVGQYFTFIHYQGDKPKNWCIPVAGFLTALENHRPSKLEDTDKFFLANALQSLRDTRDADLRWERINTGQEWMHSVFDTTTGRTRVFDDEQYRAFKYERSTENYRMEDADTTASRMGSDAYMDEVERWEDEDKKRKQEEREERNLAEEKRLHNVQFAARQAAAAAAGNGMAIIGGGFDPDVAGGMALDEGPAKTKQSPPADETSENFPPAPDKAPVVANTEKVSEQSAAQAAPKVLPGIDSLMVPMPDVKQSAPVAEPVDVKKAIADALKAADEARLALHRERVKKQKEEKKAKKAAQKPPEAPKSLPSVLGQVGSQSSKRKKLEGPRQGPPAPVFKLDTEVLREEYSKLPWSAERPAMDKKRNEQRKTREGLPVFMRSLTLQDGRMLLQYSDRPDQILILPKLMQPEPKSAPSLSVLLGNAPLTSQVNPGSSSLVLTPAGLPTVSITASPTPVQEERRSHF